MTRTFFTLALIVLVLVTIAGCKSIGNAPEHLPSQSPSITVLPVVTETMAPMSQPTFTLTPSALPTLSPEQEQAYAELLKLLTVNGGCELPCWWGLIPGRSTFQDAQDVLDPFSVIADFYFTGDRGGIYITFPIDELFLNISLEHLIIPDNKLQGNTIGMLYVSTYVYQRIDREGGDFILERIYNVEVYKKLLSEYTLSAMLSKFGAPSDILVRAEVYEEYPKQERLFLTILYPDKGIFATYTMLVERKDNNIFACPAESFIDLWLLPEDIGNEYQNALSSIDSWEGNFSYTKPLDQATQMSNNEFYQTFKEPTDSCLQTPVDVWPRN